jgi:hypothetical protein
MAMAIENRSSLRAIIEARVYILSRLRSWLAARQAIQHGLSDRLPKTDSKSAEVLAVDIWARIVPRPLFVPLWGTCEER